MATIENIYTYDIQYYMSFEIDGEETDIYQVTEDKEMTPTRNKTEYETSYLCRKTQTKRVTGTSDEYAFTIDAVGPQDFQKVLYKLEDKRNVPGTFIRTCAFDFENGKAAEQTALPAKRSAVIVNMNPMDGAVGELATLSGTAVQDADEWEYGTFNATTKTFTPAAAAASVGE